MSPGTALTRTTFFPSLWDDHLPGLVAAGHLRAIREVRVELERQEDALLEWATGLPDLFVEIDEPVQLVVTEILENHTALVQPAGRSGADPFVIALASVNDCAVVTEEKPRPTKPRIPDVCAALNVRCINLVQLMRDEGWRYQ